MNAPADSPGGEHMPAVNAEVLCEPIGQLHEEADIVDALAIGYRGAASIGPTEVDAFRNNHDKSVLISDGVVVRHRGLCAAVIPAPCRLITSPAGCSSPGGTCTR